MYVKPTLSTSYSCHFSALGQHILLNNIYGYIITLVGVNIHR